MHHAVKGVSECGRNLEILVHAAGDDCIRAPGIHRLCQAHLLRRVSLSASSGPLVARSADFHDIVHGVYISLGRRDVARAKIRVKLLSFIRLLRLAANNGFLVPAVDRFFEVLWLVLC